jgi:hypothetical protein
LVKVGQVRVQGSGFRVQCKAEGGRVKGEGC